MFQLNIKNQNLVKDFESKDNLINFLERENIKCLSEDLEAVCSLIHVDKNGEILETVSIDLPIPPEGQKLDELLMAFGRVKKKPSQPKRIQKNKGNDQQKQIREEKTSSIDKGRKKHSSGIQILSLVLAILSLLISAVTYTSTKSLAQNAKPVQKTEVVKNNAKKTDDTGKSDVFCRYFLPNYFSGKNSQLKNFISSKSEVEAKEGMLQSVLLEKTVEGGGQKQSLTYVIALKEKEEVRTERLTITIKKATSSLYGFEVVNQPKESQFP
ncbi:TPA: hypothetical protein U3O44_002007 [Streptococcus agalactiae]|nr:hypothetical protein [Streptococcus agalactiae]